MPLRRAAHGRRRGALHRAVLTLARNPGLVAVARRVVEGRRAGDRLARVAAVASFLAEALPGRRGGESAAAVLAVAMLLALGERARLEYTRELVFARVEIEPADIPRLPPFAALVAARGRYFLPVDVRRPVGFLPLSLRHALARRRLPA